jgi:hypothetical protein
MLTLFCVCLCNLLIVTRQLFGEHVPATTNTHGTIEDLWDASFSMRCLSYRRKVGD